MIYLSEYFCRKLAIEMLVFYGTILSNTKYLENIKFYLKRYMNIDRLILLFKSRNNIRLERNAVVTHDIPSNCVVGGVPAIIKD